MLVFESRYGIMVCLDFVWLFLLHTSRILRVRSCLLHLVPEKALDLVASVGFRFRIMVLHQRYLDLNLGYH